MRQSLNELFCALYLRCEPGIRCKVRSMMRVLPVFYCPILDKGFGILGLPPNNATFRSAPLSSGSSEWEVGEGGGGGGGGGIGLREAKGVYRFGKGVTFVVELGTILIVRDISDCSTSSRPSWRCERKIQSNVRSLVSPTKILHAVNIQTQAPLNRTRAPLLGCISWDAQYAK